MAKTTNIGAVADSVLAEVERTERVKQAEIEAVRAATPRYASELGQLLHKVAEDLRSKPVEVTYEDLARYTGGAR